MRDHLAPPRPTSPGARWHGPVDFAPQEPPLRGGSGARSASEPRGVNDDHASLGEVTLGDLTSAGFDARRAYLVERPRRAIYLTVESALKNSEKYGGTVYLVEVRKIARVKQ